MTIVSLVLSGRSVALVGVSGETAFGPLVPAFSALIAIPHLGEWQAIRIGSELSSSPTVEILVILQKTVRPRSRGPHGIFCLTQAVQRCQNLVRMVGRRHLGINRCNITVRPDEDRNAWGGRMASAAP